jgi:DNA topoisomerase-1
VVEGFLLGSLRELPNPRVRKGLSEEEAALAMFLQRMAQTAQAC